MGKDVTEIKLTNILQGKIINVYDLSTKHHDEKYLQ